ncbi:MAG: hypothetical protein AB1758_11765, partial [Candidatus Eremiobacterota bacterium]
ESMLAAPERRAASPRAAWVVHGLTASGAFLGLLALQCIWTGDYRTSFLWMLAATLVDAVDGFLARFFAVAEALPHIDGRRLDDIVDYLTYVLVPTALFLHAGMLVWPTLAALPLIASGLGFSNCQAKTDDDYFLGFPSYWNIVALYLWLYALPPGHSSLIVATLSVLVLVPIRYLYPTRTPWARRFTLAFSLLWAAQLLGLLLFDLPRWCLHASLAFPLYYLGASIYLNLRRRSAPCELSSPC